MHLQLVGRDPRGVEPREARRARDVRQERDADDRGIGVRPRCPSTFAKTKITVDWIERMLGGKATIRNVRTAGILADMANGRA